MDGGEYTETEQRLIEGLPTLPPVASLITSNVWIIEWLAESELKTGHLLHQWMEASRPRWSLHIACRRKDDVIRAISRAEAFTRRTGQIPILHLEAHGDEAGLVGSDAAGGHERLTWEEMTKPLQALNMATGCNLVVVIAACAGFAGIQALTRGPRAPAVGLIGPTAQLASSELLRATKELYRRWRDEGPRMRDMVESASRETDGVNFEFEPFATLCYEAFIEDLVRRLRRAKIRTATGGLSGATSMFPPAEALQRAWDEMFMMDLYADNKGRFGIDMRLVLKHFVDELKASSK